MTRFDSSFNRDRNLSDGLNSNPSRNLGHGLPIWMTLGLLGGVGAIALPPIGEMIFGLLGMTSEDPIWALALWLASFLALAAGRLSWEWHRSTGRWPVTLAWLAGLGPWLQGQSAQAKVEQMVFEGMIWSSRGAAGGLLGFFYGGRWTGENVRGAIAGLVIGLLLAMVVGAVWAKRHPRAERVAALAIALCAAYGLWFWLGAWGLAAVTAGQWLPGLFYGCLTLLFGQLAWLGGLCLGQRYR